MSEHDEARLPEWVSDGWLVKQLHAWPTRVDFDRTTSVEWLMSEAATVISALLARPTPAAVGDDARERVDGELLQIPQRLEALLRGVANDCGLSWAKEARQILAALPASQPPVPDAGEVNKLREALIAMGRMLPGVVLDDRVSSDFLAKLPDAMVHYRLYRDRGVPLMPTADLPDDTPIEVAPGVIVPLAEAIRRLDEARSAARAALTGEGADTSEEKP